MTSGGVSSSSSIDGITVTGSNPLGGALTDIGDSVGIDFFVSGMDLDTAFYGNYNFSFTNNSASDSYLVTLGFDSLNLIDFVGDDVYAESKMALSDGVNDLFYTRRYIDVFFGDNVDETCNGCPATYNLLLGAGDTLDLFGYHDISGYAFGSSYDITLGTNVSILDVKNLNAPVPEPSTILMLATGLFLLVTVGRRYERRELNRLRC